MTTLAAWCAGRTVRAALALAWVVGWAGVAALTPARVTAAEPHTVTTAASESRLARVASEVREQALQYRFDEPDVPGTRGRIVPLTQALLDSDRVFRADAMRRVAELGPASAAWSPAHRADLAL